MAYRTGDKLHEEGGGKCSEAVLFHSIFKVYFLWRPVFTMLAIPCEYSAESAKEAIIKY